MNRSALIDTVKALASQLIVLHHLALYSPMADWLASAWPRLMAFVLDDGRLAVQPFLVIGGYLSAQSLGRSRGQGVWVLAARRYLRLLPPLALALLLVMLATVLVGHELHAADWLSPLPSPGQFLAHLLLLQDVLDIPSISAGAWYVAIDLQLYALMAVLVCWGARAPGPLAGSWAPVLVALLAAATLLAFGHQAELDVWAVYFFLSYGLGALAAWAPQHRRARLSWWLLVALVLVDAAMAPRDRPLLSLAMALALWAFARWHWPSAAGRVGRVLRWLSDKSYGVFVSHYAVIVLASGCWLAWDGEGLAMACLVVGLAWAASLVLGAWVPWLCDQGGAVLKHGLARFFGAARS